MRIFTVVPSPPLGQYVAWFWYYRDFYPDHEREHVLPNGSFELIINLEERSRKLFGREAAGGYRAFKRGWLSGVHTEYLVIDALQNSSMIGIHFRPGGAAAFLGLSAGEFRDEVVELDAVWGDRIWRWREQLLEAPTPQRKFAVLEQLLLQRLRCVEQNCLGGKMLGWALETFSREPHLQNIRAASDAIGMSQKHFIEAFRRRVGVTPKRFCRIRRFQQVLGRIQSRQKVDWAAVAGDCGYYDQAHLINEFTAFSGLSPATYLQQRLEGDPNFARATDSA
jgi:AraC-like DNA-binding protein